MANYVLHDDNGQGDEDAKTFTSVMNVAPGEFLVLCHGKDFEFKIGSHDTITLLNTTVKSIDSVSLPGTGTGTRDDTYIYVDGKYKYTATPTPGKANVYTEPVSLEEKIQAQNDAWNDFFLVENTQMFSKVVDMHVSVDEESLAIIQDHPAW